MPSLGKRTLEARLHFAPVQGPSVVAFVLVANNEFETFSQIKTGTYLLTTKKNATTTARLNFQVFFGKACSR